MPWPATRGRARRLTFSLKQPWRVDADSDVMLAQLPAVDEHTPHTTAKTCFGKNIEQLCALPTLPLQARCGGTSRAAATCLHMDVPGP